MCDMRGDVLAHPAAGWEEVHSASPSSAPADWRSQGWLWADLAEEDDAEVGWQGDPKVPRAPTSSSLGDFVAAAMSKERGSAGGARRGS